MPDLRAMTVKVNPMSPFGCSENSARIRSSFKDGMLPPGVPVRPLCPGACRRYPRPLRAWHNPLQAREWACTRLAAGSEDDYFGADGEMGVVVAGVRYRQVDAAVR